MRRRFDRSPGCLTACPDTLCSPSPTGCAARIGVDDGRWFLPRGPCRPLMSLGVRPENAKSPLLCAHRRGPACPFWTERIAKGYVHLSSPTPVSSDCRIIPHMLAGLLIAPIGILAMSPSMNATCTPCSPSNFQQHAISINLPEPVRRQRQRSITFSNCRQRRISGIVLAHVVDAVLRFVSRIDFHRAALLSRSARYAARSAAPKSAPSARDTCSRYPRRCCRPHGHALRA